ncbi:MAG: hypothetical protein DRN88_01765 [Candidatus Hydrothermarchaeota archaeon]|nr:MAG: hypothetical protein DRN88_01765 [Candidatus Hydrothermarchaeota archaeon]
MFYEVIGKIAVAIFVISNLLALIFIVLGSIAIRRNRLIIPKFLIFILDTFYLQVKSIASKLGMKEDLVDRIGVEIRNHLNYEKFKEIPPEEKVIIFPQCLRHVKCPARLDPKNGIICKECGLCVIKEVKQKAEAMGYKLFIVPGSSFVYRIIDMHKPKAAIGVACPREVNVAMHELSKKGIITQGIPLLKSGCVNTEVDVNEVFRILGIEISKDSTYTCASGEVHAKN